MKVKSNEIAEKDINQFALALVSRFPAAQILSLDADDAEVLENEATELSCMMTLSNPESELATIAIEKIDSSELLISTRLDYVTKCYTCVCVFVGSLYINASKKSRYRSFLPSCVLQ